MFYDNSYWGMGIIWWIIWIILLIWIFAIPYDLPGQRRQKNRPLDILNRRLALGQISDAHYQKIKDLLENK